MPAGGTWTAQNKVRPGAYINFVYKAQNASLTVSDRGTMAVALSLPWGKENELIELTASEMLSGKSLAKVGVVGDATAESLPLRLVFSGANKAYIWRTNTGGDKATVTDATSGYSITAKYSGTLGNKITFVSLADTPITGTYTMNILVDGIKKESFTASTVAGLEAIESEYVDIDTTNITTLSALAGLTLTGGTNGTETTDYTAFLSAIKFKTFQTLAINSSDTNASLAIVNWVKDIRENNGKKIVGVVCDTPTANHEGIISVSQGFKSDTDTVTVPLFSLYIASLSAGAQVNESLTCRQITEATEIINPLDEIEIEKALGEGKLVLSYRQDGGIVIEKDINTLTEFTDDKGYPFSKNRVMRVLDEIGNSVALKFTQNYAGKVDNNANGRSLFKSEIINLLDTMQNMGAVQNFDPTADITVYQGDDIDNVVVDLNVQPVDSMEKLYMTVYVSA